MAIPAVLKSKTVWALALVSALALLGLSESGHALEWGAYRFGETLAPRRAPNPQVLVVAIDAASLQKFGPEPWPRNLLGAMVDKLSEAKAQVITLTTDLSAHQNATALEYLAQMRTLTTADVEAPPSAALTAKFDEAQAGLATDAALRNSLLRSGHVLLTAPGTRLAAAALEDAAAGDWAFTLPLTASTAPRVALHAPLPEFAAAGRGVGYLDEQPVDASESPMLVQAGGRVVGVLGLMVAARELGYEDSALRTQSWGGLTLGDMHIATDRHLQVLLPAGGTAAVPVYSFADVLSGAVPAERFAGKAVLVGAVDANGTAPVLQTARLVSELLNGNLVAAPFWVWGLRALVMALVAAYLLFLLPRLSFAIGLTASGFLVILLLNGEFVPLLSQSLWLPLMLPLLTLLAGHTLLLAARFVRERSGVSRGALSEANRELALALQSLGRYDQALARFRQCLPSKLLCDNLMSLGQEHERGRRYSQAIETYECIRQLAPAYPGITELLDHLVQLQSTPTLVGATSGVTLSRAMSSGGLQKPMLGRYELLKELGRGAMGVVYLGRDAKIGRQVAIKTMALATEFDGEALKDISERFFREAEAAGRLNHPNIVTIYDAGEDQGLAYIAMDYLAGEPLHKFAVPGKLMPLEETVAIIIKMAEALAYAHSQHVVHRDIKPANILYERGQGRVKITDFGIAALTDMSRTKTGTILGSPLYMSPEQVSGQKVDGRSDLYSLGVTFYQLLRGELPFEAPSLTGLMFKISHDPHPDVTFLRPDIPEAIKVVVDRALQKDPDARYQTGIEMSKTLRACLGVIKRTG